MINFQLSTKYMFFFDEVPPPLIDTSTPDYLWVFLPIGYVTTVIIETTVLIFLLSPKLTLKQKILCGIWLTACTYPIVVLVLPALLAEYPRWIYLTIGELFAHFGECVIFWLAFREREDFAVKDWIRCFAAILLANLASFSIGEILNAYGWFGLF